MNKVVLKETKDPMIRKMAEKGTSEQETEIKQLQSWLSKHGARLGKGPVAGMAAAVRLTDRHSRAGKGHLSLSPM
ncbi:MULTISPECIES: DUF305 domain-containing protein [Bradyrhizobium]|uniref:DUF305 domain-containing protein n=1 Tax=Bradyrhizobium TaxID=374 RepID=UPI0003FDE03F|nr:MULTISPECIES: DUF305 domain-containing protein [Bradyrhizobium]UFW46522.1 DUF305 domain-containing protein [Bradyrhizobium arachidis]